MFLQSSPSRLTTLMVLLAPPSLALASWSPLRLNTEETTTLLNPFHLQTTGDPLEDAYTSAILDSHTENDPICNDKHSGRYDPLACWLWKLKVTIPDQSFKKSLVTVKVKDLCCSNFVVDSIDSEYNPSNNQSQNPSIDLSIKGVSASCTGKYHASGGASGKLSAKATSEEHQPAIHLVWAFVSSYHLPNATTSNNTNYWIPTALNTQQCEAHLNVDHLHFSGSASAEIANLFSRVIKGAVSSQLNEILCPMIQDAVDPVATQSILSAVKTLTKYLPKGNGTSAQSNLSVRQQRRMTIQTAEQSTTVDFEKDTPLLVKSLKSVNHFFDCFYNGGCTSLIIKGLKGIFSALLDSLAEEVHVPIPKALHKVKFELPQYGNILVDIQDFHVRGLDQLEGLSILSPVLKEGAELSDFQTQIRAGAGVNVTADVNITVFPIPGGIIHGDPLHEAFHVHMNISTLDVLGIVGLALKSDQFQKIEIGTLIDSLPAKFHPHTNSSENSSMDRKCLLDSVQSLKVKDMGLQTLVDSVTFVPKFNASARQQRKRLSPLTEKLERDLDDVINHGLQLVLREYQPLLTDAAAGFAKTALVSKINHWIDKELVNTTTYDQVSTPLLDAPTDLFPISNDICRTGGEPSAPQLVNFSELSFLNKLNEYVNKPSTLASINKALDKLAAKAERHHDFSVVRSLMTWVAELDKSAIPGVSVQLRDLQIENAGSVQHIDVLSPQLDGLHLKNGFSMGVGNNITIAGNDGDLPTVHVSIGVVYRPRNLAATLNATISLGEIYLDGGQVLRFDMTRFRKLSLIELLSHGHCIIVPFQGHRIYNNHNVSRIGTLFGNASVGVTGDSNFDNFTSFMDTTTYPDTASLIVSLVGWALDTLQVAANSFARSSFEQAEGYCTGRQKFGFDDDPPRLNDKFVDKWLFPVLYMFGGLLLVAQAVLCCGLRAYQSHSDRAISNELLISSEPLLPFENGDHESILEDEDKDKEASPSETLVQSTILSAFSRQAVPVFIVGTIVLLLSSNISSGATVDLHLSWNESRTVDLPAIFTFSLLNTARDMWNAKIYPLFFLVLIMSGIWPYTKLVLMLGSWTAPTHILKPKTRERLLLALDALGKFALIDFLLFVLMMVAFRYHLNVTEKITLDVYVSPETGFYSFLAATCFSLVIGHFMVYCHRLSEMRHLSFRQDESVAHFKESVLNHNYIVGYSNEGEQRLRLSRRFRALLLFTALSAVVLLAVGITRESFKFEIGGIAGDVLGDKRTTYYSLVSLGSSMTRSVKNPSSIGILALEVIYYFYAVVTPFACLGLFFILLLCPMTLATQRVVLAMAEIANAWSAVEVFVIAIIASLLEISTFASFIVGHRCDLIKKILKEHFESAISDESDATCFTVRSSVERSSWILVIAVILNSMIVSILLRFAHCSVTERIDSEMESSVMTPSDDALDPDESHRPRTIAGLLSCGCFRGIVWAGQPHRNGYLPQSTDTYSVVASVNWQEEASHFEGPASHIESPSRPIERPSGPPTPNASVLETIRNAFD